MSAVEERLDAIQSQLADVLERLRPHEKPKYPTESDLLTTAQAAELLGVMPHSIRQYVRLGELKACLSRKGKKIVFLFEREELLRFDRDFLQRKSKI